MQGDGMQVETTGTSVPVGSGGRYQKTLGPHEGRGGASGRLMTRVTRR